MKTRARLWLRDWTVRLVALVIIAAQTAFGAAVMLRVPGALGLVLGGLVLAAAAKNFHAMTTWWRDP